MIHQREGKPQADRLPAHVGVGRADLFAGAVSRTDDDRCAFGGAERDAAESLSFFVCFGGAEVASLDDGSEDDVELEQREPGADAAAPSAAEGQPGRVGGVGAEEAVGVELLWVVEGFGGEVHRGDEQEASQPLGMRWPARSSGSASSRGVSKTTGRTRRVSFHGL